MPSNAAFLEATSDAVWENDLREGVSYLSRSWLRTLGFEEDDFPQPGKVNAWFSLVHPEDLPETQTLYEQHMRGETPHFQQELRVRAADGRWQWILSRGRVVDRLPDGSPARVIGTHIHIGAQKDLEAELVASRLRNEMLLQAVPDLLFVVDCDGNVIDYSAPKPELLLVQPEEFLGKNLHELLSPELAGNMLARIRHAADAQTMQTLEYSLPIDGKELDFEARITPYGPGLVSVIVRDITERRVIGRQLQEARGDYERLVRSLPVGVFSFRVSRSQGIRSAFVSPRLVELVHQPAAVLCQGREAFSKYLHPEDIPRALQTVQRLLEKECTVSDEFRCIDEQGTTIWVRLEVQSSSVVDDEFRIHGTASDITDRKRAESEYRELQQRLQRTERMRALGQLAGGVAHEFNNQLASVFFFVDSVKKGSLNPDQLCRYADLLRNNAQRTSELTQKLLDFSRQGTPKREIFDLHDVLRESIDILDQTLGRNIQVVRELRARCSLVLGDRSQIGSLLLNLAINARDAMAERGTLTVQTSCLDLDAERCRLLHHESDLRPGRYVCLSISDTGEGMDAETKEHIFEPFFTTKPMGKGTGLGLASVYGTVCDHAGAIGVESQPGRGTTFNIFIPACEAPASVAPEPPQPEQPLPRGKGQHLLLVDDETLLRFLLRGKCEEMGYRVTDCEGGAEAIRVLTSGADIDAVVLDVTMPGMSGLETHRALQRLQPGLPTVAITGFTNHRDLPSLQEEGVRHVVAKPVDVRLLSHTLARLLDIPFPE
jgi:PAS domain S-box-containing protein